MNGSAYAVVEHHAVVLVFEIVAVENKQARGIELGQDTYPLAGHDQYGVFPAFLGGDQTEILALRFSTLPHTTTDASLNLVRSPDPFIPLF